MTDDQIAKLSQEFVERKTLAEAAAETVSYKFDILGFARALLAASQAAQALQLVGYKMVHERPGSDIGFEWKDAKKDLFGTGWTRIPVYEASQPAQDGNMDGASEFILAIINNQPIWPNAWGQDVAAAAYFIHRSRTDASQPAQGQHKLLGYVPMSSVQALEVAPHASICCLSRKKVSGPVEQVAVYR